jgi:beta-lactamase superfamily II metal-dependent hydrolase
VAAFEIEFLRVGDGASSGDAILVHYWDGEAWHIGIIDGGYEATGREICDHVRRWYSQDPTIDFVVSTHPDNDHMSGLRVVMEELPVRELWMHVPWVHAEHILGLFRSRRWTTDGLQNELRRQYNYVTELFDLAVKQKTTIKLPLQGEQIGPFTVMSPSVDMYEGLLPQFRDTPRPDQDLLQYLGHWLQGIGRRVARAIIKDIREAWHTETLREGGITSAENESSVVLLGDLGSGGILLTGDAGLKALGKAVDYARARGVDLSKLWLFQVPHNGSRNNISPSMLNRIIGLPVEQGATPSRPRCIISAGAEDEEHPRQVVVNALCRRGLTPCVTRTGPVRFYSGLDKRDGWTTAVPVPFSTTVERYD